MGKEENVERKRCKKSKTKSTNHYELHIISFTVMKRFVC